MILSESIQKTFYETLKWVQVDFISSMSNISRFWIIYHEEKFMWDVNWFRWAIFFLILLFLLYLKLVRFLLQDYFDEMESRLLRYYIVIENRVNFEIVVLDCFQIVSSVGLYFVFTWASPIFQNQEIDLPPSHILYPKYFQGSVS